MQMGILCPDDENNGESEVSTVGANGADTAKKADNETLDALAFADKRLEEAKEEKAKRKKALIKFGTMTVLTALVLIFGTI